MSLLTLGIPSPFFVLAILAGVTLLYFHAIYLLKNLGHFSRKPSHNLDLANCSLW